MSTENDQEATEERVRKNRPGAGRPTDYKPEFCGIVAQLAMEGATDFELAQALDIHRSTFYRWRSEYPEFRDALKIGKDPANARVERALYHRAVGYEFTAVKIMQNNGIPVIVPYTEHVPPDIGAATLWLTNRDEERWKSKQSHEHTGKFGIEHRNVDRLTDEQLEAIARGSSSAPTEPETSSD